MLHTHNRTTAQEDVEAAGAVGTAVHALIALLAAKGGPPPNARTVRDAGRALVGKGRSPSARQALRCAVTTLTAVYVSQFWPVGGLLITAESVIGDSALDLLWQLHGGSLQIDELKTGILAGPDHEPTVNQAVTQALDARHHFGTAFSGVRVVVLRRPQHSFYISANHAGDKPVHIHTKEQQ